MTNIILFCIFAFGLVWIPVPYLIRKMGEIKLGEAARVQRSICLTFDDGPGNELTEDLIKLLERYDVQATFFLLGSKLDNRKIVESLINKGHEIGCHGQNHVNAWYSTPSKAWKDVDLALLNLKEQGISCQLFRPPFGKITCLSILQSFLRGKRFGWWTLDSTDTNPELGSVDSLISKLSEAGGGVVLLHDFDNGRDKQRIKFVLDATGAILEFARENDYKIKKLGDLMGSN